MKVTPRALLSTLLALLALTAATLGLSGLPADGTQPSVHPPVQLAQSTTAILEGCSA